MFFLRKLWLKYLGDDVGVPAPEIIDTYTYKTQIYFEMKKQKELLHLMYLVAIKTAQ